MAKKETSNNKNKKTTSQDSEKTKQTKKTSSATKNKSTSAAKKATAKNASSKNTTSKNTKSKQVRENEKTKELKPVIAEAKKSVKEEKVSKEDTAKKKKHESESAKVEKQLRSRVSSNDEMSRLFKIVLIVTAIFVVFYGVTLLVTKQADEKTNNTTNEENPKTTEIQYDNIMIGTMLNHGGTYYVLIEQADDIRSAEYTSLIDTIKSADDAPTIYKANLTDSFNKDYLAKEENYYVENIADFRVTGTTLVKVENGKINSVFDNYDAIKNKLKELA